VKAGEMCHHSIKLSGNFRIQCSLVVRAESAIFVCFCTLKGHTCAMGFTHTKL
jgi:hypothetical protein